MHFLETTWTWLQPLLAGELAQGILRALLLLLVGIPLSRLLARTASVVVSRLVGSDRAQMLRGFIWYGLLFMVILSALREVGFDLSVLLGAAGVLSVAVGFASQTSASNIISGLFLLVERPFSIGDTIEVDNVQGVVLSIDLLSAKLRTFDNLYVRVPNETLVKARITNLTRFPIRRIDVPVGVAYDSDLEQVEQVFRELVDREPVLLQTPAPLFLILGFGDSSVNLRLSAWATREDFVAARVALHRGLLNAFRDAGIEIPFPQRVVTYLGGSTSPEPLPGPDPAVAVEEAPG